MGLKNPAYQRNPVLQNDILPVEVVFHPSWWFRHAGLSFDEDFFYHPVRRVEAERKMDQVLNEKFGDFGLGELRDKDLPVIGAVHNAAGYLISEMLGCRVEYRQDNSPLVIPANREDLTIDVDGAFSSFGFRRLQRLMETLKGRFGYLKGDVNWGGILNLALDIRGHSIFLDMIDKEKEVRAFFAQIAQVIERFTNGIERETGTTSISVNRTVRRLRGSVFLHSECTLTMISTAHYESLLLPFDAAWSKNHRPFGIHYCGEDPHRYAGVFAKIPNLDFVDVGWGGDIKKLRSALPRAFLNIRLSPVKIIDQSPEDIRGIITTLVADSANPYLTGVCCINMDDRVGDEKVRAIFETVTELRRAYK